MTLAYTLKDYGEPQRQATWGTKYEAGEFSIVLRSTSVIGDYDD